MSEPDQFLRTFQIGFWAISITLVLCSIIISVIGWKVNGNKARELAIKKDIHDTVEKTFKSVIDLEDAAFSFWLEKDSKIQTYQIVNLHRRCLANLKQLSELKNSTIPSNEVRTLRRYCTIDAETEARPLQEDDERLRRISRSITQILDSDLLKKTWSS
ncbi:hypothetical protein [Pseudomonas kulmbachensis]|uniref:hypothetical protein n=1 Tax=Pseudomonas kulmbachensis TaxID=3043408 RepID=UPI002AB28024|nr:hypothetical protein [Pseudomonas sp. V3/3/4/13]